MRVAVCAQLDGVRIVRRFEQVFPVEIQLSRIAQLLHPVGAFQSRDAKAQVGDIDRVCGGVQGKVIDPRPRKGRGDALPRCAEVVRLERGGHLGKEQQAVRVVRVDGKFVPKARRRGHRLPGTAPVARDVCQLAQVATGQDHVRVLGVQSQVAKLGDDDPIVRLDPRPHPVVGADDSVAAVVSIGDLGVLLVDKERVESIVLGVPGDLGHAHHLGFAVPSQPHDPV